MNEKIKKVNKIMQNYNSVCGILYTSKEINQETKEKEVKLWKRKSFTLLMMEKSF